MQPAFNFKLVPVGIEQRRIVENLARFYLYEVSGHCGLTETLFNWAFPADGLYTCSYCGKFWENPTTRAFLIYVNEELGGFAIVNKTAIDKQMDWNMCEFFIVAKFQGHGIGKAVASQLFDKFPGNWEVSYLPSNIPAKAFWEKVVASYTRNEYTSSKDIKLSQPHPYEMLTLRFNSAQG